MILDVTRLMPVTVLKYSSEGIVQQNAAGVLLLSLNGITGEQTMFSASAFDIGMMMNESLPFTRDIWMNDGLPNLLYSLRLIIAGLSLLACMYIFFSFYQVLNFLPTAVHRKALLRIILFPIAR